MPSHANPADPIQTWSASWRRKASDPLDMNGESMSNTNYASMLDWEQQLDYELEQQPEVDIEQQERKAFADRCRRAKVPVTKLKKYENEVDEHTKELKADIESLEWRLKHCRVGVKRKQYANIYLQSDFDKWRTQLADKQRQLDNIINRIHYKYFK
jgi:hypothetical protein